MIRFRRPVIACSKKPESWNLSNLVLISLCASRAREQPGYPRGRGHDTQWHLKSSRHFANRHPLR
jgi:hypothetical protein